MMKLAETLETQGTDAGKKERDETGMPEGEYSFIMAITDRGYREKVKEAAGPKGTSGGTACSSRRAGCGEAMHFWGIAIQPEFEAVMIFAEKKAKPDIMKAIGEKCGRSSEAYGMVKPLPADGAAGLE